MKGKCNRKGCKFKHLDDCKFFQAGNCSKGDNCTFRHLKTDGSGASAKSQRNSQAQGSVPDPKKKSQRPLGSSGEDAESQAEGGKKSRKRNKANANVAFPIRFGMATAYASACASSASGFTLSSHSRVDNSSSVLPVCVVANEYDNRSRNKPDILDRRWFCSGDPDGLPVHTEIVYRYWSYEYEHEKRQSYAEIKEQIKNNKSNVSSTKYPTVSSAIRAAKDLCYSLFPRSKFVSVQGRPSSEPEPKPAMTSQVERTWIIDSGATYSLTGNQSMTREEKRRMTPSNRDVVLSTAGGLQVPEKDIAMPITDLGCYKNAVVCLFSPDALAIGEKCLDDGWDFHWVRGIPWFVTDNGEKVELDVEN